MTENVLLGAEPRAYSSIAKQFLEKHAAEFHFEGSPTQLHPQLSEVRILSSLSAVDLVLAVELTYCALMLDLVVSSSVL